MMNQIDIALYAGLMVYIAQAHPDLYNKINGQVPQRVRVILNEELGTDVDDMRGFETGLRKYMQALKARELSTKSQAVVCTADALAEGLPPL